MDRLIIFDFDGVIAESEVLANTVLAEIVSELGVPTSLEDSYRLYIGKRFVDVIAAVETSLGHSVSAHFPSEYQARTLARFREELRLVEGAQEYLKAFVHLPRCIASSSSPDRLALCLDVLGLQAAFDDQVFSASDVARGKPHPDLFLHAAQQMEAAPSECIVIEDSPSGVEAGVAAGMTVIGLLAASHIQSGHGKRLRAAGAHFVAPTFKEAERITHQLLSGSR